MRHASVLMWRVFGKDFGHLMEFLNEEGLPAAIISPRRFGQVLQFDVQGIASQAHVHRNTVTRAPASPALQNFLKESLQVLRAAVDVSGSVEKAIYWFRNEPLQAFDYKTAQDLVTEKRSAAVIKYLQSLQAGFAG